MEGKTKALVWVLVVVIVILAAIVLITLVISPAVSGFATQNYNQGVASCMTGIISQSQQSPSGVAQIPIGGNQVLICTVSAPQPQ